MVSHTARYASVLALLAEKTGNHTLGAIARRSWDWASYMSDDKGRVIVGPRNRKGMTMWFSDGYGDFIRNTIYCLGANASWAPMGSNHILRSDSLVTHANYGDAMVKYSVFNRGSVQKLTLRFVPSQVSVDGLVLSRFADATALQKSFASGASGWWFGGQSGHDCVVHHNGTTVLIADIDIFV